MMKLLSGIILFYFAGLCLCTSDTVGEALGQGDETTGFVGDEILSRTEKELEEAIDEVLVDKEGDMMRLSIKAMKNMISSMEKEVNSEELRHVSDNMGVAKKTPIDFMGTEVSFAQYFKLVKLQEKVIKLNQMIETLHNRYNQDLLNKIPEYHRIMHLQASLLPLFPKKRTESRRLNNVNKRSPFSVDFLGLTVSYPQYLRLKLLQEKVIRLDQSMKQVSSKYSPELLETNPKWLALLSLHASLKKLLPLEYLSQNSESGPQRLRAKRSTHLNEMIGDQPIRLPKLHEKVLKMDNILIKLSGINDPKESVENAKWLELLALQQNLEKLILGISFQRKKDAH